MPPVATGEKRKGGGTKEVAGEVVPYLSPKGKRVSSEGKGEGIPVLHGGEKKKEKTTVPALECLRGCLSENRPTEEERALGEGEKAGPISGGDNLPSLPGGVDAREGGEWSSLVQSLIKAHWKKRRKGRLSYGKSPFFGLQLWGKAVIPFRHCTFSTSRRVPLRKGRESYNSS